MSSLVLVVRHRNLKAVYNVWIEKCAGETLPTAASFEPGDLRPWLDHVVLIDIDDVDAGSMRYSFHGEGLVEAFGVDLAGKAVGSIYGSRTDLLEDDYRKVVRGRLPIARIVSDIFPEPANRDNAAGNSAAVRGGAATGARTGAATWEGLLLPLFDDDGSVVKILGAMYPLDR